MREMIRYCRQNDIALTFVSIPCTDYLLLYYEGYDVFIALVNQLLAESGSNVEYVDFNLMRPEYWPGTSTLFSDSHHLNGEGAQRFSEIFCRYFNGEILTEDLFYPSAREKLADLSPGFYGVEASPVFLDEWYFDCQMVVI